MTCAVSKLHLLFACDALESRVKQAPEQRQERVERAVQFEVFRQVCLMDRCFPLISYAVIVVLVPEKQPSAAAVVNHLLLLRLDAEEFTGSKQGGR
jgi:hypothetical protein